MITVKVKNIEIGQGMPKICIPVTGKNREEILKELELLQKLKPDLVEWRIDCYEDWRVEEKIREMLETINDKLNQIPLLFTFRTAREGGSSDISFADYVKLLKGAAKTGLVDLIDVEVFFQEKETVDLVEALKQEKVSIVGSNHHFDKTPSVEEMLGYLRKMDEYGADILKLAVMPKNKLDVCRLLETSVRISGESVKPVVTMSMGKTGVLSRICGECTGSCITFAAGSRASAPGQIEAEKLRELLKQIHEAV